jgi:hypothetical protein
MYLVCSPPTGSGRRDGDEYEYEDEDEDGARVSSWDESARRCS